MTHVIVTSTQSCVGCVVSGSMDVMFFCFSAALFSLHKETH